MTSWTPYLADKYVNFHDMAAWCRALCDSFPRWFRLSEVGQSRMKRPLLLVTVADHDLPSPPHTRPSLWIDAATHACEWTGVSAALYSLSRWAEAIQADDQTLITWLQAHTITVMPCLSPDGYQAMHDGAPFLRSTLRPPRASTEPRVGLDPCDIDGDGAVAWMRWRHPSGPFVIDASAPLGVRWRTLHDDPASACHLCSEGEFLSWDGTRWTEAPLRFGLDLNRNFPAEWKPFSMFGMDSGDFPLSEPESRATMEAFLARPQTALALSLHTYTGCILTEPNRADSPICDTDILMMENLALQSVQGTGYRVIRGYPDFMYDPKKPTIGIWSDTLTEHLGVVAYTVELWDPYGYANEPIPNPAAFFRNPDPHKITRMLAHFAAKHPDCVLPWRSFQHPQLGLVELGGLDYLHTVRNPPLACLPAECERCHTFTERTRLALPKASCEASLSRLSTDLHALTVTLENVGYLPTFSLQRALDTGAAPSVMVELVLPPGVHIHPASPSPSTTQALPHLSGWGWLQHDGSAHPIYPSLSHRSPVAAARWTLSGPPGAEVLVRWRAGRAGQGALHISLTP